MADFQIRQGDMLLRYVPAPTLTHCQAVTRVLEGLLAEHQCTSESLAGRCDAVTALEDKLNEFFDGRVYLPTMVHCVLNRSVMYHLVSDVLEIAASKSWSSANNPKSFWVLSEIQLFPGLPNFYGCSIKFQGKNVCQNT